MGQHVMQEVLQHMSNLEIIRKVETTAGENTYLCINTETKDAILIDPSTREIEKAILENECQLQAIVLTHAHFDHILEVDYFANTYDIPVYVHALEARKLSDPMLNLSAQMYQPIIVDAKPTILNGQEGSFEIEGFQLKYEVRDGHSEGNLMIQVNNEPIYFVGDSIFATSIGRYDLPGSDARAHHASLTKFVEEQRDGTFYSGHDLPFTKEDMKNNPVLSQFLAYGV